MGVASNFMPFLGTENYPRSGGTYVVSHKDGYLHGNFNPNGDQPGKYSHFLVFHDFETVKHLGTVIIGTFEFDSAKVNEKL